MVIEVLSPQSILGLVHGREPVIDISGRSNREFILRCPKAISAVLHREAQHVTRPSKIFYWRLLAEHTMEQGLPLAIRTLKKDYFHSLQPQLLPGDLWPVGEGVIEERKLNVAVLSVLMSGYCKPLSRASLEYFIDACNTVEHYKSLLNARGKPNLPDRLLFSQAVSSQRSFALDIFRNIGKDLPANLADEDLYRSFKEEVDSLIGILHFSCKNISNAIGWTLLNLSTYERAFCQEWRWLPGQSAVEAPPSYDYLYAVILESLRLFPPNWLFHRTVTENFKLCEHSLREGDLLHISPLLTHRSSLYWEDPGTFIPVRFLRNRKIDPWAYIPFGRSFTKCPGTNLSFKIIRWFVEMILSENLIYGHEDRMPLLRNTISLNPFPLQGVLFEKREASLLA